MKNLRAYVTGTYVDNQTGEVFKGTKMSKAGARHLIAETVLCETKGKLRLIAGGFTLSLVGFVLALVGALMSMGCATATKAGGANTGAAIVQSAEKKTEKAIHYCGARTLAGTPCKRRVKAEGEHCYQHKGL